MPKYYETKSKFSDNGTCESIITGKIIESNKTPSVKSERKKYYDVYYDYHNNLDDAKEWCKLDKEC